jgi:hypothetical protein
MVRNLVGPWCRSAGARPAGWLAERWQARPRARGPTFGPEVLSPAVAYPEQWEPRAAPMLALLGAEA